MNQPHIADTRPAVIELEPGDHWWCACGHSKNQPFCDGSHKGTGIAPRKFSLVEKNRVALCNCKHSANPPYCDGTHSGLA